MTMTVSPTMKMTRLEVSQVSMMMAMVSLTISMRIVTATAFQINLLNSLKVNPKSLKS